MKAAPALNLSEIQWTWRRAFAFLRTLLVAAALACIIFKLTDPSALKWIALALVASGVIDAVLYMAGATATDIARLTAAARSGAPPSQESAP